MLDFDPKVTIEGFFTALGVFGAACGYVLNLVSRIRASSKDKRQRADRLTIMDILEGDLVNGMTESEIKEAFTSEKTAVFRKRAGCTKPAKLKDEDFSRYLRDLQWNHMIDQLDCDRYRLRTKLLDSKYEAKEGNRHQLRALIQSKVPVAKIINILNENLSKLNEYERSDLIEAFGFDGIQERVLQCIRNLDSTDPDTAFLAAKELMKILRQ